MILSLLDDDIGRRAFDDGVSLKTFKSMMDCSHPGAQVAIAGYKDQARLATLKIQDLLLED